MANVALYSGTKCYFFSGDQYIRVTRGDSGAGTVDPGYPAPISNWGWGDFGANGIDAALHSGTKCYFFSGDQYIRVTRGDSGAGTVDPGYPAPLWNWAWEGLGPAIISPRRGFGELGSPTSAAVTGIDAALYSGTKCYFFSGDQYIRVTRGDSGAGTVDPGYPAPLWNWNWREFEDTWAKPCANHFFDPDFSRAEQERILERQLFALNRVQSCNSLSPAERADANAAYRNPIRYGREPSDNGRGWLGRNWLFVNLGNFANNAERNRELSQTLVHEMMHVANYSHPTRSGSPGDNGPYYGTVPLQAELCIGGVQSDEACTLRPDGSCSMG